MLNDILQVLSVLVFATSGAIFYRLYSGRYERVFGLYDRQLQGIQLILWFAFLGFFINVAYPWLVGWDRELYPFVVLPVLLTMLATILWILYPVRSQEELDF